MKYPTPRASCPRCRLESYTNTLARHICFEYNIHESERIAGIYNYWRMKRMDKKGFSLSGPQMISLFDDAGISPKQIGKRKHEYQLARYGDTGPYEIGNCRFITMTENRAEVKRTGAWRGHSQESKEKIRKKLMGRVRTKESINKQKESWKRKRQ